LKLAGAGPEHGALLALAGRLGLGERFTMEARIPSTEMPDFYRSLDCLVLASRTLPNWTEQFGRVLIEAMACGVPVISSTSGEAPNVVGEAGLIFPEGDAEALAGHLRALLADPNLRARLANAGRERVLAHFTQKAVAAATVEFYESLVNQKRG
jgi:glycosyltransferase involved in cell wall biosynthesis